ncbi:MAG: MBL fold metallo-hydrolase [Nannocystaceae bacterium]
MGNAQDGGLPHAACSCPNCSAARDDRTRRDYVSSLALILPSRTLLIDATPDIREQLELLRDVGARGQGAVQGRVDRHPVDGVLLTHAHIGHYLGLAFFGFEAVHTKELQVYATPKMSSFLAANAPWEQLVRTKNLALHPMDPGERLSVGDGVFVTPIVVPHRDEYADTVAFVIEGPRNRVLFIPDTDPWARWSTPPEDLFADVDVALVDGTFYSGDELPGRDLSKIGHPLIRDSMTLLGPRVESAELEVLFIHLNHSNPAHDPASEAHRQIVDAGFSVARHGLEIPL